ncbi:MAG: glycogen synthase [Trueperaceae bacterium]|nr:glycogen synthase [Trueperaceae bacterium]
MRILFASSEVFPYSKTGGLADVAGALPGALADLGHEVLVVTPWYDGLRADPGPLWIGDVDVPFAGGFEPVGVGTLEAGDVRYVFVGHDDYRRPQPYGYPDDVRRFARFTRSVPAVAQRVGFRPDVVHAHDWHTGYLPLVLTHGWHLPAGWPGLPTVFTIHNVQYQGVSPIPDALHWLRLPLTAGQSGMNHFGSANAMQAALDFASKVTTVSPSYAEEVQRPEYGYGLDGTLRHVSHKLVGILNGIDRNVWNPATDPELPEPFTRDDMDGKRAAGVAVRDELGLDANGPLMGVVSRFADQKGIDVLFGAAGALVERGWRLAILGSGDAELEARAQALAAAHPGAIGVRLAYAEDLAHRIYGGADTLAIPSRFEPCGLSQMIAMRYGTLPVARATGGLRDTIRHGRTGFLFDHATTDGLLWAAEEARVAIEDGRAQGMRHEAMSEDFGWSRSAERYQDVYRELTGEAA